jgi:hypothetical protein
MLKYSQTTDDGRSRVGYFCIFISDSSLVRYSLMYIDVSILRSIYR